MKGNEDCFAYDENKCICLDKLYCAKEKECRFYKSRDEIDLAKIERQISCYNPNLATKRISI